MQEPELEISKSGIKVRRLSPLAIVVIVAIVGETIVTTSAMWVGTKLAWDLWVGFSFMVAAITAFPLLVLVARGLVRTTRRREE